MAGKIGRLQLIKVFVITLTLLPPLIAQDTATNSKSQIAWEKLRQASQALAEADYSNAGRLSEQAAVLLPDDRQASQTVGELLYRAGYPLQSLAAFDRAVAAAPAKEPENWQRGIALATCGEFERAAEQFRIHHRVNPDDVENSAWYFLCLAKTQGIEAARQAVLPSRGDARPPMMSILKMFQGEMTPEAVIQAANDNSIAAQRRASAVFYAQLYVGLYYDALGQKEQAAEHLRLSREIDLSGYMPDVARVYLAHRFEK